jgi:Rieske Fe-S protein
MENVDRSRRALLWTVGAVLASAAFLASRLTGRREPARTLLVVEKRKVPARGALVYRESRIAVVREGDRYHALSLVCTHLGCTVEVTPKTVACPCHGSVFDRSGKVVRGPADRPLERYEVEDRGDSIAVLARA